MIAEKEGEFQLSFRTSCSSKACFLPRIIFTFNLTGKLANGDPGAAAVESFYRIIRIVDDDPVKSIMRIRVHRLPP